jgi:hypothetical protein
MLVGGRVYEQPAEENTLASSTHVPEPLRSGSGRLFFTGPSYRIPVSRLT